MTAVCTQSWEALRGDLLAGLLDDPRPGLRWRVLVELVGRPEGSAAVVRARSGANAADPIACLLRDLQPDGSWRSRAGMWSRYSGSGWRLIAAVQLGADRHDPRLRAASDVLLKRTPGEGGFAARSGERPCPCLTARALQAVAALGQRADPRFKEAMAWLEDAALSEVGWQCDQRSHHQSGESCVITAVGVLGSLVTTEELGRTALRDRAAEVLVRYLASQGERAGGSRLGHPNLARTDHAEVLNVLATAGRAFSPEMKNALAALQAAQSSDGWWRRSHPLPASLGLEHSSTAPRDNRSAWITLRAATAVMHYAVSAALPRLFPSRPQ